MKRVSFAVGGPSPSKSTSDATARRSNSVIGDSRGRFSRLGATVVSALRLARRFRDGTGESDGRMRRSASLTTASSATTPSYRRASGFDRLRRPKRDPSGLADVDEDGSGRPPRHKNAIFNEEIARLRIREEDLMKISQEVREETAAAAAAAASSSQSDPPADAPPPEAAAASRRVAVAREIPPALRRPRLQRVALLRRATFEEEAAAAAAEAVEAADESEEEAGDEDQQGDGTYQTDEQRPPPPQPCGTVRLGRQQPPGPQLDHRGRVVPHSLLGRPEEFYRMGLRHGHLRPEDVPCAYREGLGGAEGGWDRDGGEGADGGIEQTGPQFPESAAGSAGVRYDWMHSRSLELPQLIRPTDQLSAREHNRSVLNSSARAMRRVTEQLNQCGRATPMTPHMSSSACLEPSAGTDRQPWQQPLSRCRARSPSAASSAAAAASLGGRPRSARLAGPMFSFIGGWSYQKQVLLG